MDTQATSDDFLRELLESTPADAPPSYEASGVSLDTIRMTLESEATQGLLKGAIEQLGNSAQDMQIAFRNVSQGISNTVTIGQEERQPQDSDRLGQFKEDWDDYHKKYVELIWESRRIAGNARAIALDFAEDFLDVIQDETYSLEKKKQEITSYRQELEKDKENARNLSIGFTDLQADVMAFGHDINEHIKQRIDQIADEIQTPRDVMEMVKKELGVVSHMFSQMSVHNDWLKRPQEAHERAAEVMTRISATVSSLQPAMNFIQEKLASFAQTWPTIYSELSVIEKELELVSTSNTNIRFEKRMKTVSAAYKSLVPALRLYEAIVRIQQSAEETE